MQDSIERYEAFAARRGWRFPDEHKIIVREIFNLHDHFTEHDLATHPRLANISAKKQTLVLERLVEAGLVRKMLFGEKTIFFEHVYGHVHHDHLICITCGSIAEFRDAEIEERQQAVCRQHDFRMIKHSMHILGECAACRKKQPSSVVMPAERSGGEERGDEVPLSTIPGGETVLVSSILGGTGMQRKLHDMGLVPKAHIRVVANRFSGPFIIQVHESRLAIGHQITHKVLVRRMKKTTDGGVQ